MADKIKICFCGLPLKKHPHCPVCEALYGTGHPEQSALVHYHGARICRECRRRWQIMEKSEKHSITYIEFKTGARKPEPKPAHSLTPAQIKIINLAYQGLSYKQIAWERKTTEQTIRDQMVAIFIKLQVHSRGEAVYKAIQLKLIEIMEVS